MRVELGGESSIYEKFTCGAEIQSFSTVVHSKVDNGVLFSVIDRIMRVLRDSTYFAVARFLVERIEHARRSR